MVICGIFEIQKKTIKNSFAHYATLIPYAFYYVKSSAIQMPIIVDSLFFFYDFYLQNEKNY